VTLVVTEILIVVHRVRLQIPQLFGGSVFTPNAETREPAMHNV